MAAVSESRMAALVEPYLAAMEGDVVVPDGLYGKLAAYLQVLLRWNARTNLTAVRDAEEIVRRHFGESLFAGGVLARFVGGRSEILDLGSGAGFPGIPVQLLLPEVRVSLAESQGKKAAFLREVVRVLGLGCEVWAGRVEAMPSERRFDAVMLRAVDRMGEMTDVGRSRVRAGGLLLEMVGGADQGKCGKGVQVVPVPGCKGSWVRIERV